MKHGPPAICGLKFVPNSDFFSQIHLGLKTL